MTGLIGLVTTAEAARTVQKVASLTAYITQVRANATLAVVRATYEGGVPDFYNAMPETPESGGNLEVNVGLNRITLSIEGDQAVIQGLHDWLKTIDNGGRKPEVTLSKRFGSPSYLSAEILTVPDDDIMGAYHKR